VSATQLFIGSFQGAYYAGSELDLTRSVIESVLVFVGFHELSVFHDFASWSSTVGIGSLGLFDFGRGGGDSVSVVSVSSTTSSLVGNIEDFVDSAFCISLFQSFCGISGSWSGLDKVRFFIGIICDELFLEVGVIRIDATRLLFESSREFSVEAESSLDFTGVGGIQVLFVG
jgi:hypothetical protein